MLYGARISLSIGVVAALVNMVIGVLIIGVLDYGMSFLNINQYWKYVVLGIALLAAVTIDTLQTRAAENAAKKVTGQAPTESQNGTAAK